MIVHEKPNANHVPGLQDKTDANHVPTLHITMDNNKKSKYTFSSSPRALYNNRKLLMGG